MTFTFIHSILVRTPDTKHGHEWTKGGLNFYRIRIVYDKAERLFQNPDTLQAKSPIYQAPVPDTFDTDSPLSIPKMQVHPEGKHIALFSI